MGVQAGDPLEKQGADGGGSVPEAVLEDGGGRERFVDGDTPGRDLELGGQVGEKRVGGAARRDGMPWGGRLAEGRKGGNVGGNKKRWDVRKSLFRFTFEISALFF